MTELEPPNLPTLSIRQEVGVSIVEGVLGALLVTATISNAVWHVADPSPLRPTWIPTFLWLWGSLAVPVSIARLAYRLRRDREPWAERSSRAGSFLLGSCTLALVVRCGWGLGDPLVATILIAGPAGLAAGFTIGHRALGRRRRLAFAVVCLTTLLSLPLTHWPLRLTVALSRSALDDLADQVLQGRLVQGPTRAGVLVIQGSQLRGAIPFLLTGPNPAGFVGLVRSPPEELSGWFNLWSSNAAASDWQLVVED